MIHSPDFPASVQDVRSGEPPRPGPSTGQQQRPAKTQAQKLRVENEALAAELKRAEIVGIERNATIICLRTELDLRRELRADHDILIAQREAAATRVDQELALVAVEVAALRDLISKPKRRLFKRR